MHTGMEFECVYSRMHVCRCPQVWKPEDNLGRNPHECCLPSSRQGLTYEADWRGSLRVPLSASPRTRIPCRCHYARHFYRSSGDQTPVLVLAKQTFLLTGLWSPSFVFWMLLLSGVRWNFRTGLICISLTGSPEFKSCLRTLCFGNLERILRILSFP